jgi:acyl-CoA thioester hydrolase
MRAYRLHRRVSHADVDFLGELKLPALLGLCEQAAVEASTEAGYDAAAYMRERRIWIIRRTRLERLVPVGGGDSIEVETSVTDFRRARSLRRYVARRDGVEIARATTDWVYCDITSGQPMRVPEALQHALLGAATAVTLGRAESLRAEAPPDAVTLGRTVLPSHLDHVTHVNNAVYASYLEDAAFGLFATRGWPLATMLAAGGALRVRWIDAEYLNDAFADEQLTVRSWCVEGHAFQSDGPPATASLLQTITHADGRLLLRAASDWVWRRKPAVIGGVPE